MIPSRLVFAEKLVPASTRQRWIQRCAVACVVAVAASLGCSTGTPIRRLGRSRRSLPPLPRARSTGRRASLRPWPQVWPRFAPNAHAQLALAVDPESLTVIEARESAHSNFEAKKLIEPTSWFEGTSPAHVRVSSVVVVRVDPDRSVLAWTEGSINAGLDVRLLTVGREGEPLGAPVTLAHEGSAIGLPALALASSGRGLIAFLESNGRGFQLVAASLDCRAPDAMEASASRATFVR